MQLDNIDVIALDIDDTLYLERDYVRSGFAHVSEFALNELGCEDFGETCQRLHDEGTGNRVFDVALSYHGIPPRRATVDELVTVYRNHQPEIFLLDDAKALLDHCYETQFPVAIISDGPINSQTAKADALGLYDVAELVVLTDQWGKPYWKPHRRAFEAVQSKFGEPCSYLYVADNPETDFVAAKQLGWSTIRIRRDGGLHSESVVAKKQEAHWTVSSLRQLLDAGLSSASYLRAA